MYLFCHYSGCVFFFQVFIYFSFSIALFVFSIFIFARSRSLRCSIGGISFCVLKHKSLRTTVAKGNHFSQDITHVHSMNGQQKRKRTKKLSGKTTKRNGWQCICRKSKQQFAYPWFVRFQKMTYKISRSHKSKNLLIHTHTSFCFISVLCVQCV